MKPFQKIPIETRIRYPIYLLASVLRLHASSGKKDTDPTKDIEPGSRKCTSRRLQMPLAPFQTKIKEKTDQDKHHVLVGLSRGIFPVRSTPMKKRRSVCFVAEGIMLLHLKIRNHQDFSSATARATSLEAIFSQCRFASSSTAVGSFTSS